MRTGFFLLPFFFLLTACSGGTSTVDVVPIDAQDIGLPDTANDVWPDARSEETVALDAGDLVGDAGDVTGLPMSLGLEFERPMTGDPLSANEVNSFTLKLLGFYTGADYFKWLRRVTYGVHESTGKRDFALWWTGVSPVKSGDTVTFVHRETNSPTSADGGHNLMTRTSKLLASNIAGYLMTGDQDMRANARQLCKGVSQTMLGMVHDEDDELLHLMARNVVAFNHEYTTFEGKLKAVDYSNWYHEGTGWNCHRFNYPDNPYWGSVWVTNMRSKDDISRLMRVTGTISYAAEQAPDDDVREACGEAYELLLLFYKDIVDNGYRIRTKDKEGNPFIPGDSGNPELDEAAGDLASYVEYDALFPNAQCNAKRSAALIAYGEGLENNCGDDSYNTYEALAVQIHYFNIWLIRSYHVSHVMQCLVHRDWAHALQALQGLADRYQRELYEEDPSVYGESQSVWERDVAQSLLQAAAVGYPLNWDEARLIQQFYARAADEYLQWPYWDLWDAAVPDGEYAYSPPDTRTLEDGSKEAWGRVEDMGAFLDYCWSPFRNPAGAQFIDCDLVKDRANWPQPSP